MRKSHVFVGTSHPELGQLICDRLGVQPGKCTLRKFSNGETSIEIGVSVRDEDVYVVQSGSSTINDHIMELLILISGCRGGSANKITAVIPSFPYAKQSKMKKHRGAITARMLANLLIMAGADHVITMDLHATQMQGFFSKPVDNLLAGPTLARWIKHNVPDYTQAVIVSKNPGGTKRVTALADALKVNFAMIHTDRRRNVGGHSNSIFTPVQSRPTSPKPFSPSNKRSPINPSSSSNKPSSSLANAFTAADLDDEEDEDVNPEDNVKIVIDHNDNTSKVINDPVADKAAAAHGNGTVTPPAQTFSTYGNDSDSEEEEEDINTRSVHVARVVQGHVVSDTYNTENPAFSGSPFDSADHVGSGANFGRDFSSSDLNGLQDCSSSIHSNFQPKGEHALGGTGDAESSDDEEDGNIHGHSEKVITLVGDVYGRTAIILDDMIDRHGSFVAAAELCYNNCGAKKVIVVATHAIFSGNSLEELENCPCIDQIVVTNTYPIPPEKVAKCKKLVVIDVSSILAECIRRNHYGESISALFDQLTTL